MLVDAHIHFRGCFRLEKFLDGAVENFVRFGSGRNASFAGALLFAEPAGGNFFTKIHDGSLEKETGCWSIGATAEKESWIASRDNGPRLLLICGRQIVTAERLELLALGTTKVFPDGLPVDEVFQRMIESEAMPVLPWGFGKWLGRRGGIAERMIGAADPRRLFIGDNASRPAGGWEPRLFSFARERGFRILPGSDPLPLRSEETRAGRYGFAIDAEPNAERPMRSIRVSVESSNGPRVYGQRDGFFRSVRNQLALCVGRVGG